jgi:hypothetical protein
MPKKHPESSMQQGRGGMGSHKHGTSGHSGKSPKLRYAMKREAEANEIKAKPGIKEPAATVGDLLKKKR